MAVLTALAGAGVSYVAWKSVTPTAKWVLATAVISTLVDDVLFEQSDFGPSHLFLSAAIAAAVVGVT